MVHYPSTVYHFLSAFLHFDMNNILQMIQEHFLTYNVYYVKLNTYKNIFYIIDRKIRFWFKFVLE
jgi:hypothetical protein